MMWRNENVAHCICYLYRQHALLYLLSAVCNNKINSFLSFFAMLLSCHAIAIHVHRIRSIRRSWRHPFCPAACRAMLFISLPFPCLASFAFLSRLQSNAMWVWVSQSVSEFGWHWAVSVCPSVIYLSCFTAISNGCVENEMNLSK